MKQKITLFLALATQLLFAQSNAEIQKLKDFAEIYGVVRYFHPSDESRKINWNQFAAYGTGQVLKTGNQKEFEMTLKGLFSPISPAISFEGKEYQWNQVNLVPVFWIHKGLGVDAKKKPSAYKSKRFNRGESESKQKKYLFINLNPNGISSNVKISYEAKSDDGGESFVYANLFNKGNEKANFQTHQKNPVTSEDWVNKELILNNNLPVEKINFGLMCTQPGSEFRNVKLWYQDKNNEWILYNLPKFTDAAEWKVNNPNIIVERNDSGIKFPDNSENGINPFDVKWDKFEKLNLSNNLSVVVPTVVYSDKNNTLPASGKNALIEIQSNLKPQTFNRNIAIANVIISWNILKHFYPYQDVVKINWSDVLEKALRDAYDNKNEYDNYLTLSRFTSNFDDGHMAVFYRGLSEKRRFAPGIAVRYINNQLMVKNTIGEIEGIHKGDIISKIDNIETRRYIDSLQQYISGSKQYKNWISSNSLLRGTQNSIITLELGNGKKVTLKRDLEYLPNSDFYTRDDVSKSKEINADTYYVNMDKLSAKEMEAEIPNIRKYKNLIIDLRGYPRTDQSHVLLNYLFPEDSTKWLCGREIYLPNFKYYKEECHGHRLRSFISDDLLKTNNVLLVDERSVSNAEMFSQVIKHYKLATIIGRVTAGANGNRNDIDLLNDFQISFTGLKVINPDGSRFHAIGVLPDIIVNETDDDLKDGKDVYIEKAMKVFKIGK